MTAAEIIRKSGWRPIAEAPEGKDLICGSWCGREWSMVEGFDKRAAIATGKTHYLPEPETPVWEVSSDGRNEKGNKNDCQTENNKCIG